MSEEKASFKEHLSQIAEAELVTQAPEDHQHDDIRRALQVVERRARSLVEPGLALSATKTPVSKGR